MRAGKLQRLAFGIVLVALLATLAIGEEEERTPVGLLPTPAQSDGLWIKLGLPDGRSAYALGENIRISFAINQQAYVYVFDIPPNRQVLNLFPNQYTDLENPLKVGEYTLPDNERYNITVTEEGGLGREFIGAIASVKPISELEAKARVLGAVLSEEPQGFQDTTSAAIQGLTVTPNQETLKQFNIAVISIQTYREQTEVPQQGLVFIKSDPVALLFIDGLELGYTLPQEFRQIPVDVGQHTISLKRQGYQGFEQSVTIEAGKERIFDVKLNQLPRPHFRYRAEERVGGQFIRFTAVESEDDGTIVKYEWDFESDGRIDATGFMARHFFPSGEYRVTLTVTDDQGAKNSVTETIKVAG